MLQHEYTIGRDERRSRGNRGRKVGRVVRRIQHGEIEYRRCGQQRRAEATSDNNMAVRQAAELQIVIDQPQRPRVRLHKRDMRRAAAERLDPDGAGAGIPVEDANRIIAR